MSVWRCSRCERILARGEAVPVTVEPIVKLRSGGVDQFSNGGTRLTCPDHPGAWLELMTEMEARHADR
jgi:hypothetical protein